MIKSKASNAVTMEKNKMEEERRGEERAHIKWDWERKNPYQKLKEKIH